MNTISTDFGFIIEHDHNPFVLFSNEGAILYLNKSAELIIDTEAKKTLFDLALTHAPQSFGHRVALMELSFSSQVFYGINVLYANEEEIAIQLYHRPRPTIKKQEKREGYTLTDLNLLLQANIELFRMSYRGKLSLITDYTMPQIHLHQNSFSLLLRKVLTQFSSAETLEITMTIKIGSKIVIVDKSHPIISLKLQADQRNNQDDKNIRELALSSDIDMLTEQTSLRLEIPAIY